MLKNKYYEALSLHFFYFEQKEKDEHVRKILARCSKFYSKLFHAYQKLKNNI